MWESGETKIIAATTALIQGYDRNGIRFVLFHDGAYGAIMWVQGSGRGGRDGIHSYVFTIVREEPNILLPWHGLTVKDPQVG